MDSNLLNAFNYEAKKFVSVINLTEDEVLEIKNNIFYKFGVAVNRNWCWESINLPCKIIEYGENDGLECIKKILGNTNVKLMVTDEELPPWFGFKGKLFDFIEIIRQLRYFEFFIIDDELSWIIFDTHHNALIICGLARRTILQLPLRPR